MIEDDAYKFFWKQLKALAKRVEDLEEQLAGLQAEKIRPSLVCPTRREFQQLEDRVKKLDGGK
jgi:hypothetical protein